MAEIETLAVIGGSALARTIALTAARSGYRTILQNILPASLRQAGDEIRENLAKVVQLGQISLVDAESALHRLEYVATVEEAAREADLVIEAVPDEIESK